MVRTRFAPSPTGYLHIGGVRTALFNWLFARKHGGQFILRIDDTDAKRNVEEALLPILDGFKWLGIDWDEGPTDDGKSSRGPHGTYFQSQRGERYQQAIDQLIERGAAYRDYATDEEFKADSKGEGQERRRYSRKWMAETPAQATVYEAQGRSFSVRLKMPAEGECRFYDHIRGQMVVAWAEEQDILIQRSGGGCTYHLANVVDDHDFAITHVIRAAEHLSNTPRQIFIAQSLGYSLPEYAHVPVVNEPGGSKKLSKRDIAKYLKNPEFKKLVDHGNAIARRIGLELPPELFNPVVVDFYREVGYLPDAIINYILLLGWSLDGSSEEFTRDEMVKYFSLERVNKAPASFDPAKLFSFQDRYMQRLDLKKKVAMCLPFVQRAGWVSEPPPCDISDKLRRILTAAGDRVKVAGDILDYPEFFVADDRLEYDAKAVEKRIRATGAAELLKKCRDRLAAVEPFDASHVEEAVKKFVDEEGIKIGDIIHALRVAVSGKAVGVGMFDTLEIVGKQGCLNRIDRVLAG